MSIYDYVCLMWDIIHKKEYNRSCVVTKLLFQAQKESLLTMQFQIFANWNVYPTPSHNHKYLLICLMLFYNIFQIEDQKIRNVAF